MERFYCIAGIHIRVLIPDELMYRNDGVLSVFVTEEKEWDYSLKLESAEPLLLPEGRMIFQDYDKRVYRCGEREIRYMGAVESSLEEAYLRIERRERDCNIQVQLNKIGYVVNSRLVADALEAEHMITEHHGFILHASYIAWNGRAILFTAPSGTGKSTQAELWRTYRGAELINGDRAAVRVQPEGIIAHGIPFSGSSGVGKNKSFPLGAIVYLSQAPYTAITRLSGVRAFRNVWEGCSINIWNRKDIELGTQTVAQVISSVPVYHLACTPDETAVTILETALRHDERI